MLQLKEPFVYRCELHGEGSGLMFEHFGPSVRDRNLSDAIKNV